MNCDKEYGYEVIGYLLAKVEVGTGEEVLNRHGDIKLFKHLDNNIDVMGFSEESVEEIPQ
jgi:hypothetical protein